MAPPTTERWRISDVAQRTGFSSATLRYYEDIGLLPAPSRTAAGYRSYTARDLARLDFIARAKQLGCSLDEIRDVVDAWDGDRCAPVQHRLRSLVVAKLADAQERIAELLAFTAQLRSTAAQLAAEPQDGPCNDECACLVSGAVPTTTAVPVAPLGRPGARTHDHGRVPIACSLDGAEMDRRIEEWRSVLGEVDRRERLDGGIRLVFGEQARLEELARLAAAERRCCPFFSFAVTIDGRGVALEVTAPPDGNETLVAAFGTAA